MLGLTDPGLRTAVVRLPPSVHIQVVDDGGVPAREIAEVIGKHLDVPVASVAIEDAYDHFGWIGPLFSVDAPATSTTTRELLGWQPTHAGLLDDLDAGHYFDEAAVETD